MKKKNVFKMILLLIIVCGVLVFVVSVCKKKVQIEEREVKVLEATKNAITALEKYRINNDSNQLHTVIKELEVCYKYLREIEEIREEEKNCWEISMVANQLKSYDKGDEIKALDDLELALQHMKENIYSIGNGYFISFVNKNMIDYEQE